MVMQSPRQIVTGGEGRLGAAAQPHLAEDDHLLPLLLHAAGKGALRQLDGRLAAPVRAIHRLQGQKSKSAGSKANHNNPACTTTCKLHGCHAQSHVPTRIAMHQADCAALSPITSPCPSFNTIQGCHPVPPAGGRCSAGTGPPAPCHDKDQPRGQSHPTIPTLRYQVVSGVNTSPA
jgi:hypothetical protein